MGAGRFEASRAGLPRDFHLADLSRGVSPTSWRLCLIQVDLDELAHDSKRESRIVGRRRFELVHGSIPYVDRLAKLGYVSVGDQIRAC